MRAKNKTLLLLIAGFVFLFLAYRLHFFSWPNGLPENDTGSAKIGLSATSSAAENKLQPPPAPPLKGGGPEAVSENLSLRPLPASPAQGEEIGLAASSADEGEAQYYKVAKVVDGDTIDIIMNNRTERLRLIGINTPEVVDPRKTVECFGREASANAKKLLDGREVRIAADPSQDDRDIYGRLLRYVWRQDGLFYNLEAVHGGFAYEYTFQTPYQYQTEFKAAQKSAQENKLGLWADGACGQKNISAPKSAAAASPASACLIKGNIGTTGDKIYHLPDCPYYKQTVINESQGEKWFCAEAEAIAAGWRKAKNCP